MQRDSSTMVRAAARAALLWALLPSLVLLGLAAVGARLIDVPLGVLVREATTTGGLAYYAGGLSAVNVALWSCAAAVGLLAVAHGRGPLRRVLGLSSLLSLALALDDQFRVHDDLLPRLGVDQVVVYLAYATLGLAAVVPSRALLTQRGDSVVLLGAAVLLAGSVGIDVVEPLLSERFEVSDDGRVYLEDGLKLCGAALWLRWSCLLAGDALRADDRAGGGAGASGG